MQFYNPAQFVMLWAVAALIVIFYLANRRKKKRLQALGVEETIRKLMPSYSPKKRQWKIILLLLVFIFSILALARPQWGEEKKKIERKGVDIIFVLDTSLSMLTEDVKPSRIVKAKIDIKSFVRNLRGDRVGLVAFAGSSFLQSPLTLDYAAFNLFLDAVKVGYIPDPGTSLTDAIRTGLAAFPPGQKKYKVMIVFSDGEHHQGAVSDIINRANEEGVVIYTVGFGTKEGEPIPLKSAVGKTGGYKKNKNGEIVISKLHEDLLSEIAYGTGGLYLPATPGGTEVEIIYKSIQLMGKRTFKEQLVTEREDQFQIFLMLAVILLIVESMLNEKRKLKAARG